MRGAGRAESRAAAERLDAIAELFELRRAERGEAPDWAVDTWAAVGAEVAAAFRISQGLAGSYLRYALAMRERLPRVAAVFRAGDIDFRMFATIVYRTDLITDDQVLAAVDAQLAVKVPRWPSMSRGRLPGRSTRSWPGPTPMRCGDPNSARSTARCGSSMTARASRRSMAACSPPTPMHWTSD
jgi:hypothetical protein